MIPSTSSPNDAPSREHRIVGFEPDNLLAFLALLGLMRAIDAAKPAWKARSYWDVQHLPSRPIIATAEAVCALDIAGAAALGCEHFVSDYDFGKAKLHQWRGGEVQAFLENARSNAQPERSGRVTLLCALASDAATREDGTIVPTPLCLLFGQGHQYFLERLFQAVRLGLPAASSKQEPAAVPTSVETMKRALFETWRRTDRAPTFRWDPEEDRRYALRANKPATEPVLTVAGAQALAALGLALLTVVPVTERGQIRLRTVAVRSSQTGFEVTWPIWAEPLSLPALRALLANPVLAERTPNPRSLEPYGVYELRRAKRISVGKYLNFTRAVAL
jgi:hypothetical protein